MLSDFKKQIQLNFPFLEYKKVLIATSGGVDSMVLVHLFQQISDSFSLAHCNFKLRGSESDEDQKFVSSYAIKNAIPYFTTQFDTATFARESKLSIQVAARELRYHWFYELVATHQFDYIVTAHHADDALETVLINFVRGTGLEGLTGIPAQNNLVIRPLLNCSRQQILDYAHSNAISWREDSSNASDYYLRNKIRHDLVPILKELNPNFLTSFQHTISFLAASQKMVGDAASMVYDLVVTEKEASIYIDIIALKKWTNYQSYLYQWLSEYGFSAWDDIYNLVDAQSGKQVLAPDFRIIKDRNHLIINSNETKVDNQDYFLFENQTEINFPLKLKLSYSNSELVSENSSIFVDANQLVFPLTIRKWKKGDFFQPYGMGGKSKKISKFFKDQKMSLIEKEKTWLLCSDSKIVWVIGIRQDERYSVVETTQNKLQIVVLK